jgi:hypothetical protein
MLNSAAQYLNDQAASLASVRNAFNDACYAADKAFGSSAAAATFEEFFSAWFAALDGQAETLGSVADATQQCAVVYDHAERSVLGDIAAMPTAPPPQPAAPQPGSIFDILNPQQREA